MKNRNNFHEIRDRINLYFDNALSSDDEKDLMKEVSHNPKCNKLFQKEKTFRNFLKNNVTRPSVSPDLIQSIKDRIRVV